MKAVFWLGIMALMQISRLRFKQSRISMLIPHIYVLGRFVNFLVIFRNIWRYIVFLKGLIKFMETENIYILKIWCCFKIRILKVKINRCTPNSCPTTWAAIVGSGNCLVEFHHLFSPFFPLNSLNFLKFHLNSCLSPP